MNWRDRIQRAFAAAGHDPDPDVVEELAQHALSSYAQARADGRSADGAEREVEAEIQRWIEQAPAFRRRRNRPPMVQPPATTTTRFAGILNDVRYGARLLRKRPGATALTVLTMALGIGATTVLFSVVSGVLLKPLPWPDADRLVRLSETRQGGAPRRPFMTNGPYLAWRDTPGTIEAIAGWASDVVTLTAAGGEPRRVRIATATASLFDVLRVRPSLGAAFTIADEASRDRAIISNALWHERFGGAADVLGRSLTLDGRSYTIGGVLPPGFNFPDDETCVWLPYQVRPVVTRESAGRHISIFSAIARLRPGATAAQASEEGTARARQAPDAGLTAVAVFGSNGPAQIAAVPMLNALTGDVRQALLILLAAVGLLLATATANVASVQLARATTRQRELAIRAAIGAGGRRLAQQLLIENVITGMLGGVAGLALAFALHAMLPSLLPADFPRAANVTLDIRVAAVGLALSAMTGILFGLLPVLQVRGLRLVSALTEDGQGSVGAGRTRTATARSVIMTCQVAIAVVLLVGASLLLRSFQALLVADRGYVVTNVLSARIPMPDGVYSDTRRAEVMRIVLDRLRTVPGVTHAAFTTVLPLTPLDQMLAFTMPSSAGGQPVNVHASLRTTSPDYFAAMGIRLLEGRTFDDRDGTTSEPVVIVNRTFARTYFTGSAVGRRIPVRIEEGRDDWTIAGVVDDVLMRSATEPPQPEIYVSVNQLLRGISSDPALVIRASTRPEALATTVRAIIRDQDSALALDSVMTMEDRLLGTLARPRLYAVVLGGFALFALVIAAVGLFGVLSYTVAQRAREIGVRTALGATRADIVRLVVKQGVTVTVAGILCGVAGAFVLSRWMGTVLYGVTAHDLASFLAMPAVLVVVALAACYVPARRAASIDPLRVLRSG